MVHWCIYSTTSKMTLNTNSSTKNSAMLFESQAYKQAFVAYRHKYLTKKIIRIYVENTTD